MSFRSKMYRRTNKPIRCSAITLSGHKCSRGVPSKGGFCYQHCPKISPGRSIRDLWGDDLVFPWEILDDEILPRLSFSDWNSWTLVCKRYADRKHIRSLNMYSVPKSAAHLG